MNRGSRSNFCQQGITTLTAGLLSMLLGIGCALAQSLSNEHLDSALRAHVYNGHVNYPALASDARFLAHLEYIKNLDTERLASKEQRLSFWINAYNALAIKGILDGGSPSSFFGRIGYFSGASYLVAGREINLYDLERKVLIPLGEPRVHFAINCASFSCPLLSSGSYEAARLDEQLDIAARTFINDEHKNHFDQGEKVAYLSKIFDWFPDDFGGSEPAILSYVAAFVADPALAEALRAGGWRVKYLDYDWSLNGIPPTS